MWNFSSLIILQLNLMLFMLSLLSTNVYSYPDFGSDSSFYSSFVKNKLLGSVVPGTNAKQSISLISTA